MSAVVVVLLSLAILVVGFLIGWLVGGVAAGLSAVALLALPILVIGFLIGWLVEWHYDNQYRRMRELGQKTTAAAQAAPEVSPALNQEIVALSSTLKQVVAEREEEVDELRTELHDALQQVAREREREDELRVALEQNEASVEQLRQEFAEYAAQHPDDLTVIKGIGRIYQWKLRDAGINTYKELAFSKPERIREVLQVKKWQKVDPESWIEQAQALTRG